MRAFTCVRTRTRLGRGLAASRVSCQSEWMRYLRPGCSILLAVFAILLSPAVGLHECGRDPGRANRTSRFWM